MSASSLCCSIFLDPNHGSPGDTETRKGLTWCFTNLSWIPSACHCLHPIEAGSREEGGRTALWLDEGWEEWDAAGLGIWWATDWVRWLPIAFGVRSYYANNIRSAFSWAVAQLSVAILAQEITEFGGRSSLTWLLTCPHPPVSSSDCRPDNLLQGHVS